MGEEPKLLLREIKDMSRTLSLKKEGVLGFLNTTKMPFLSPG
jgi:hypothetical protein